MKWIEIITLRSPGSVNRELVNDLLKDLDDSDERTDTSKHLVEIKVYHQPVVETDLSIHIYWKSKPGSENKSSPGSQNKSPLGLRFSSALKPLGLLNHSVWVETSARRFPIDDDSERRHIPESDRKKVKSI
jgi:hypothetical protein